MWDWIYWLYLIDATLLIGHEIDSAYWKEWDLFRLPGGIGLFVLLHLPLVFVILWGVTQAADRTRTGLILALVLAGAGLFAFVIHIFFILRGRPEFRTPVSIGLLMATLIVSAGLGLTAVKALLG